VFHRLIIIIFNQFVSVMQLRII